MSRNLKVTRAALPVVLTLGLLAAALEAPAQQARKVYRVGIIFTTSPVSEMAGPEPVHPLARAFVHGLRGLGYVEGQNLILERRSAEGRFERFGDNVAELVRLKADVIEIVFPKEGVPLVVSPSAITSFAPHPNAARLFTDFIFSRDLQQVLADSEGLYTGHPDVKYPADRPKLSELNLLRVDPEELEKRNEEIKMRFVEFFGA